MSLRLSHLIGGDARSAADGGWLEVFEPATGAVYAHCPAGTAQDVDAAVAAARDAFDQDYKPLTDWRATAEYRQLTAKNLLTRFFLEVSGTPQELQRFATEEA